MLIRIARIGSRNRVVLPTEVMDALGLEVGDAMFFVVRDNTVRLSRSPETFGEYWQMPFESLPVPDDPEDVDPRQMQFGWEEEET